MLIYKYNSTPVTSSTRTTQFRSKPTLHEPYIASKSKTILNTTSPEIPGKISFQIQKSVFNTHIHCSSSYLSTDIHNLNELMGKKDFNGLRQDCSNSIANAMELLQSCTKPSYFTPLSMKPKLGLSFPLTLWNINDSSATLMTGLTPCSQEGNWSTPTLSHGYIHSVWLQLLKGRT